MFKVNNVKLVTEKTPERKSTKKKNYKLKLCTIMN